MSNVKDYRKWLKKLLKESKEYPKNANVIIMTDGGEIMEGGFGDVLEAEEIMEVSFNGDDVEISVTTDY